MSDNDMYSGVKARNKHSSGSYRHSPSEVRGEQEHHIIPQELWEVFLYNFRESPDFSMECSGNRVYLACHHGSHPVYTYRVRSRIQGYKEITITHGWGGKEKVIDILRIGRLAEQLKDFLTKIDSSKYYGLDSAIADNCSDFYSTLSSV